MPTKEQMIYRNPREYGGDEPVSTNCCEAVPRITYYLGCDHFSGYKQCPNKKGHGKDGLFCKQHAKQHPEK
jgi:hypothetical protein